MFSNLLEKVEGKKNNSMENRLIKCSFHVPYNRHRKHIFKDTKFKQKTYAGKISNKFGVMLNLYLCSHPPYSTFYSSSSSSLLMSVFNNEVKNFSFPKLAIIGRPNVGKSSIFNRIASKGRSGMIVDDVPGVTRDIKYETADWSGYFFKVIDTGGLVFDDNADVLFSKQIRDQAFLALSESDCGLFIVDGQVGLHPQDEVIASFLRKQDKPIYVCVNKCESYVSGDLMAQEFYSLGFGDPIPCSAIQGTGIGDILDLCITHMKKLTEEEIEEEEDINIAIIGRPNVGKSSFLNAITGFPRCIVSDLPGTTRDAIDMFIQINGQKYRFVDTAGIRKESKVKSLKNTEYYMLNRAYKAINRSDIVLLVLDASTGICTQDVRIAQKIADSGKSCAVILNKWDLVKKTSQSFSRAACFVKELLKPVKWAEVAMISAKFTKRLNSILPIIHTAVENHQKEIKTSLLNEIIYDSLAICPPTPVKGQVGKVYYAAQVGKRPPKIVLFCNRENLFNEACKEHIDSSIRQNFDFKGTPIRYIYRSKPLRATNSLKRKQNIHFERFIT